MIKKITPDFNGKIKSIDIEVAGFELQVTATVFCVVNSNDTNNIGTILEKYRASNLNNESLIIEQKPKLERFVRNLTSPFAELKPDCIVCFYPADLNRKSLLKCFKNKLTAHIDMSNKIDYSLHFNKKDSTKSVKQDNLTLEDFELTIDNETPFKNILMVDDVIDQGKTINIFLELLADKGLVDNKTTLNLACIYNRPKQIKMDYSKIFKIR